MNYKILFSIVVATIYICSISSYASVNDNGNIIENISGMTKNNILNNSSLSNEHMNLLSETNKSNSEVILHHNNILKLLNNGYSKLPVYRSNSDVNNKLNILHDSLKEENSIEKNDNNNIILNISEQEIKIKNKESICKHLTTMTYSIALLPMAIYGGIISNIRLGTNRITQDINNKLTEIRNGTKEFSGVVCNNTMSAFGGCVTILCSKITNVGTNALGGAKSYVVRKIWG